MNELNLDKNSKYLLACSFGPDSMALFYMLVTQGYHFDCAIVNYHLREESDSEVKDLEEYAAQHGVKVYVYEYEGKLERNIESRCREIRYSFFARLFKKNTYDALLVAHHEDDLIETYLIQKHRQNCPIYYGIKEKTVINGMPVIRPLLAYGKKELYDFCRENNVPFAIDKTNFDISILRNRFRHEVIGIMDEHERRKTLREIEEENLRLEKLFNSLENDKLNKVEYLKKLDDLSLQYALNILLKKDYPNKSLSRQNVGEIKKALFSEKPNISFAVKGTLVFAKSYGTIEFESKSENISYSYVLKKPVVLDTPYFYLDFTKDSSNRNVKKDDYPITIRLAKPSDYVFIKGYKVLVRRLFIDWKMPAKLRKRWPIILDKSGNPLYIPRYQKDFVITEGINFFVK